MRWVNPRPWRGRWVWGAGLLLALLAAFAINSPAALKLLYPRASRVVAALPQAPEFVPGQRVLMVSPHPDDESLCCAGQLQQARAAGAQVYIVWLTSGDGFELDAALRERTPRPRQGATTRLGNVRIGEATQAARVLGVPVSHLTFLGYPDGALMRLYRQTTDAVVRSPHTGAIRVPYTQALSPGAAYTRANLERDLGRVFDTVKPDVVLIPSTSDFHRDHQAVSLFAQDLLNKRGWLGRARYWIVHGGMEWPLPKGLHPGFPLLLAPRGHHLPWLRDDLTPEQEQTKLQAIRAHRTQMEVMPRFLEAFVRENELVTVTDTRNPRDGTRSEQQESGRAVRGR